MHNVDFEGFIRLLATIAMRHVRLNPRNGHDGGLDVPSNVPSNGSAAAEGGEGVNWQSHAPRAIEGLLSHMQRSQIITTAAQARVRGKGFFVGTRSPGAGSRGAGASPGREGGASGGPPRGGVFKLVGG